MSDLATIPAQLVRVVDVETSGLPEDEQRAICEIGWVDLDLSTMKIVNPVTMLVNPGHPIPPHIRGIHHISNAMVADAVRPDQALARLMEGLSSEDVFCAHRATFEQAFIGGGDHRWLCTWKCGMRAWQDALSHSNQALRYLLDVDLEPDFDPAMAKEVHRSLPDAYVTAFILRRLLSLRSLDRLLEISGEPPLTLNINFGKHKGMKWSEVPANYLDWLIEKSDMDAEVKGQAQYWRDKRKQPPQGGRSSSAGADIPPDPQTPAGDNLAGGNRMPETV